MTNKFSNFGYFNGATSPRATATVGMQGNIGNEENEIEVSIEDEIEANLVNMSHRKEEERKNRHNPNQALKEVFKQGSINYLKPSVTQSPDLVASRRNPITLNKASRNDKNSKTVEKDSDLPENMRVSNVDLTLENETEIARVAADPADESDTEFYTPGDLSPQKKAISRN